MQYVVRSHIPFEQLPLVTKVTEWPVFFASAMYVFEGIALVGETDRVDWRGGLSCDLGSAGSTENERARSVRAMEWRVEHGRLSRDDSVLLRGIFRLHSLRFGRTWLDQSESAHR